MQLGYTEPPKPNQLGIIIYTTETPNPNEQNHCPWSGVHYKHPLAPQRSSQQERKGRGGGGTNIFAFTLGRRLSARMVPILLLRKSQQIQTLDQRQRGTRLIRRAQDIRQQTTGQQITQNPVRLDRRRLHAAGLLAARVLGGALSATAADTAAAAAAAELRVGARHGGCAHAQGEQEGRGGGGQMHAVRCCWWWWWCCWCSGMCSGFFSPGQEGVVIEDMGWLDR